MKKIIFAISGIIIIVALALAFSTPKVGGLLGSNDFITKYINTPNAVLVDVRTPAEYDAGHIADAIDVDFENTNFSSDVKKLDPLKTYFVYCRSGNRSAQAIVVMKNSGIKNIYELQGGISASPELLK